MEFLNQFLDEESVSMKTFLRQISSPLNPEDNWIPNLHMSSGDKSELGRHLSILHTILFENVSKVPSDSQIATKLRQLLDDINSCLNRPTVQDLEKISQSTLDTLAQQQQQQQQIKTTAQQPQASSSSSTSDPSDRITLPWGLGTLPKPMKKHSQPAPHHKAPGIFGSKSNSMKSNSTQSTSSNGAGGNASSSGVVSEGISHPSDTSSSSASLTPSPGAKGRRGQPKLSTGGVSTSSAASSSAGRHEHGAGSNFLMPHPPPPSAVSSVVQSARAKYHSQISLDETDSSDDSTYSSQYQSDANSTPLGLGHASSNTLPRQMVGGGYAHYSTTSRLGAHHHHQHPVGNGHSHQPGNTVNGTKSLSDYEQEILELRSAMEQLQIKLGEAELKLQSQNGQSSSSKQESQQVLNQLLREEDMLRRGPLSNTKALRSDEKEKMIQMQQQKIAVLDEASTKLSESLSNRQAEVEICRTSATPVKQRVAISSTLVSVNTSPPSVQPQVELSGAKTVTAINTTASPTSTSPQPSTTSSSSHGGLRRFGSPSSTISSASSTSSNTKSSPNRSITVITNGQAVTPVKEQIKADSPGAKFVSPSGSIQQPVDSTPKTVDELLDSLHSTPI